MSKRINRHDRRRIAAANAREVAQARRVLAALAADPVETSIDWALIEGRLWGVPRRLAQGKP